MQEMVEGGFVQLTNQDSVSVITVLIKKLCQISVTSPDAYFYLTFRAFLPDASGKVRISHFLK
jgi:hypothetical protein